MAGIRLQSMTAEGLREHALALGERVFQAHRVEAESAPCRLRAFHDKGCRVGIELVRMRPDPAVSCFFEDERERVVESLMRAEPDVLAGAHVDIRLEHMCQ